MGSIMKHKLLTAACATNATTAARARNATTAARTRNATKMCLTLGFVFQYSMSAVDFHIQHLGNPKIQHELCLPDTRSQLPDFNISCSSVTCGLQDRFCRSLSAATEGLQ